MGRHKEFDEDVVLDKAMGVFWQKGYEATSVQELVESMEINRGSLYDTFGDKHSLFLTVLDRYRDQQVTQRLKTLLRSKEGIGAIRQFFNGLVEARSGDRGCRGCLMVNSTVELAPHDDETAGRVAAHMAALEEAFYRALMRAHRSGEIQDSSNLRGLARFLVNNANGLCVMAKISPDRSVLQEIADIAVSTLK